MKPYKINLIYWRIKVFGTKLIQKHLFKKLKNFYIIPKKYIDKDDISFKKIINIKSKIIIALKFFYNLNIDSNINFFHYNQNKMIIIKN